MKLVVHTDGGARGNPGPGAVGVVVSDESGKKIFEFGKTIGEATNNVAEYTAVIEALKSISSKGRPASGRKEKLEVNFYLDSILVVNQLNGIFKVKDSRLREMLATVRMLEQEIGGEVRYASIPREQNQRADFLVNRALDTALMSG
jgi:ribonuclease HI